MIKLNERYSYGKLLTPPVDYKLEFAIGTTYSLDLNALIGVPISLALSEEMDDTFIKNPIALLEGIRKASDKFVIFNEGGQIKVPNSKNFIYSLIENSVYDVTLENQKSFHPKLWAIKYVNDYDEAIYRIIILSRNLTFDRSWDMVVALEGKKEGPRAKKNDLQKMLSFLTGYCTDSEKRGKVEKLIGELSYVKFNPLNSNYKDMEFLSFGSFKKSEQIENLIGKYHELLIISPFISKGTLQKIAKGHLGDKRKVLITRKSEIVKLDKEIFKEYEIYVVKDDVIRGEALINEWESESVQNQDIHAKFYATSYYAENNFFIGSANCSHNAFNGNTEFLLRLLYKRQGFRVSSLIDDLFGEKDNEKENPFERVYKISENIEVEGDILDRLEKEIKRLCRCNISGRVFKNVGTYSIELHVEGFESEFKHTITPILVDKNTELSDLIIFNELALEEIGQFFKVTAYSGENKVSRIIKVDIKDIPKERDSEIFKNVIGDKNSFLKYVSFILSDNYLVEVIKQERIKEGNAGGWSSYFNEAVILYENMLKTMAKQPDKIDDINEVINIIGDDEIVPDEFKELYEVFKSVWKRVSR